MLVIPAIDLKDGQCVRLKQGRMDEATSYGDDPVAMAARWVEAGARRLHLVDLNGAFEGKPVKHPGKTLWLDPNAGGPNVAKPTFKRYWYE